MENNYFSLLIGFVLLLSYDLYTQATKVLSKSRPIALPAPQAKPF